jgi:multicomponent K+:H+ antiporter subunit E
MTRFLALLRLLVNLARDALASGWATARIILLCPKTTHAGLARLDYGDLDETAAGFLAAMITLTPGTTAVEIDTEHHVLLLHLLDLDRAEATLAEMRRDLIEPLRRFTGGHR